MSGNTCGPANMLCITSDYAFGAIVDTKQIFHSYCTGSEKNIYINTWREHMDSEMYSQI